MVTILGIVVAAVILIVIIYLIGSFFGLFRFSGKQEDSEPTQTESQTETQTQSEEEMFAVKDVYGKSQEEAQQLLEQQGLYMFVVAEQKSDLPKGTIVGQDPTSGTMVSKGTTVNVIIAGDQNVDFSSDNNQENVIVQGVTGKSEQEAVSILQNSGLKVSKNYEYSDSVEAGMVISQNPSYGTSVTKDSTVTLVISQGKKSVKVPSVTGKSKSQAVSMLEKAGLKAHVREEYSDSVEAGVVIGQSIAGEKLVPADSTVTITVSLGVEEKSYSFSKTYNAPANAVSVEYSLVGSDGVTYDSGAMDTSEAITVSASDMECDSGTVTIVWTIETIDEEGLSDTTTKTESHAVKFQKQ